MASMFANATLASSPAAPSTTASSNSHCITIRDTTSTVHLAASSDGNLYLTSYPESSPGTSLLSIFSTITNDDEGRSFHYHPAVMSAYGKSHLRLSTTGDATADSRILTLVPVSSGLGTIHTAAVDTVGGMFLFAWCNAPDWIGAKVLLIRDANRTQT
ncbi:uncharacterized protein PAC_05988 [Phialocephala subalpina]|uniref:Uncharacterized protein n=1 Tax=Phialocephala subalpina TaxID=576137 RepID=A0A1L7WTK1_9HELO|nr:uncharacterized protein PAC_05988 [Phialocephala subalpina]